MSLRFIYGPAGAGKSTYLHEHIAKEAEADRTRNFLLIVPDQFTMQTQADIVKATKNGGILNIDVLSFERLCYRVFSETGEPETPILDDTGKSLVIRRVAGSVSKEMPYIGGNLNKVGYIHEVKSQISEFMQYGVSVKDVEKLAERMGGGLLSAKLSDLARIYKAFMEFNRDRFITGEEKLDILCNKMPKAELLKGAFVAFDGFTGFTPIQERVVLKLLELDCKVYITLTLSDPEDLNTPGHEEKLFYLSRTTCLKLKTKAKDLGVTIDEDIRIDGTKGRASEHPSFTHLEKNLFRYPYEPYKDEVSDIHVYSCDSIEAEVSNVALRITDLVREKGLEYRDIAVVCGDLESYAAPFETRMRETGIPFFMDRTRAIVLNPFTEYLKSALKIVTTDYSYDSVFHFLRSGFTDIDRENVDRFDKYVRSLNLRGKAYRKEFTRIQRGFKDKELGAELLLQMEEVRKKLTTELSILERPAETAGDYVRNLYDFIKNNDSFTRLQKASAEFEKEGNAEKAGEYSQVYKLIMELLEVIDGIIGSEKMDPEEFYRIFEAGIAEIRVGNIPGSVDRVVIGDMERTRLNKVKALFFVGVNDGNIPKNADKGGFLSSAEKEKIEEAGYELSPTPRQGMYTQRLYLYMNLLKPEQELFLSFTARDRSGKAMFPSYLVDVIKKLFPKIPTEIVTDRVSEEMLINPKDSLRYYAGLSRGYSEGVLSEQEKTIARALLKLYKETGVGLAENITDSAFAAYVAKPLSREIVRLLYTEVIKASVSRMELYAGCAYAYFLQYGMQLKEDEDFEFRTSDLGNIYHGVLDRFAGILEKEGKDWASLDPKESEELVSRAVDEYCREYEQGMLSDDERSAYTVLRIKKMMIRTVETLKHQLAQGKFKVADHEYSFKRMIDLPEGKLLLNGKIDRIDLYEEGGKVYVKIVDYKSGGHELDLTDVYYGLNEQLVVYMKEALKREEELHPGKEAVPSAMFYYLIDNPLIGAEKLSEGESPAEEILKELRPNGIMEESDDNLENLAGDFKDVSLAIPVKRNKDTRPDKYSEKNLASADEIRHMTEYTEGLIKKMASEILNGNIAVSPFIKDERKSACAFCRFNGICRFEEGFPGFAARGDEGLTDEEIRSKVMGAKKI